MLEQTLYEESLLGHRATYWSIQHESFEPVNSIDDSLNNSLKNTEPKVAKVT